MADEQDQQLLDVFDNNGQRGQIPAKNAEEAFGNRHFKYAVQDETGAWKPMQAVKVTDNLGNPGWMPAHQVQRAIKERGFTVGQPMPKTTGDRVVNGNFKPNAVDPQVAETGGMDIPQLPRPNSGDRGIDPFLQEAGPRIRDAAKSTGHMMSLSGRTLLRIPAVGAPAAFEWERQQQEKSGGVPRPKELIMQPLRELAGERQPGESVTLGFTGHDPSQQPLLTRTANAASSLMGGDPASARTHFSQAKTLEEQGKSNEANNENQRGTADLIAVPLATVGTGRLMGARTVKNAAGNIVRDVAASVPGDVNRIADVAARVGDQLPFPRLPRRGSVIVPREASSAIPRIQRAANSLGLTINTAGDALDAISQAKQDLTREIGQEAGLGKGMNDLPADHPLRTDMNALDTVQQRIQKLQTEEAASASRTAGKTPATKGEAAGQIASGIGKYAASRAIGHAIPFGGPITRAALHTAGITSGFSDLAGGMRGLFRKGAAAASPLDEVIQRIFSGDDHLPGVTLDDVEGRPPLESLESIEHGLDNERPEPPPLSRDISISHDSDIMPPEQPHGDARVVPIRPRPGSDRVPLWQRAGTTARPPLRAEEPPVRPFAALPAGPIELGPGEIIPPPRPGPLREGVLPAASRVIYDPVSGKSRVQFLTSAAEPGEAMPARDAQLLNSPDDAVSRFIQEEDMGGLEDVPTGRMPATAGIVPVHPPRPKILQEMMDEHRFSEPYDELDQHMDTPSTLHEIDRLMRTPGAGWRGGKSWDAMEPRPPLKTRPVQPDLNGDLTGILQASIDEVNRRKGAAAEAQQMPALPRAADLDPTSPAAARISELRRELASTTDAAERQRIQEGIDYELHRAGGVPWNRPDQATRENLPAPEAKPPGKPEAKTVAVSRLNPGEVGVVDTKELKTDPSRFQYKRQVNEEGVSNALKDQKRYDPTKGGVLLVWEDPADKKTYVVNGHHRYELANRTGYPSQVVMKIRASSAAEARAIGAEVNISEGHGTGTDAARFFKAAGIRTAEDAAARDLPLGQAKVQDGLALARLDDSILDKIESGQMTEQRGVAIGTSTADPAQQEAILKLIEKEEGKGRKITNDSIAELARFVTNSGNKTIEQGGLFGANMEIHSLALDKADISAYVKQQIAKEKRAFGAVASQKRAQQLGTVQGQSIKAAENARIAEQAAMALEAYNKLSSVRGPVNDILEKAARDLSSSYYKPEGVKAKAYEEIRKELQNHIGGQEPPVAEARQ
jgi:ParB-like chromosome segregation protein Spo0J